jgi:hypothetical protein
VTTDEEQAAFPQTVTPLPINYIEEFAFTCPPFILTMASMQCTLNNIDVDGKGGCMENQFDGERNKYFEAIEAATNELVAINRRLEELHVLQQRARQLEDFIGRGKVLLGQAHDEKPPEPPSDTERILHDACINETPPRRQRTAVECARLALEAFKRPMRAQEMADYLEQRGLMQGQWTREVLRTAMRKHPDFERIDAGLYALTAWPPALKSVPEQQAPSLFSRSTEKNANGNLNLHQPLTTCIVELLETAKRPMSPGEIEKELRRCGKVIGGDSVSSALSRLVRENRIKRPTTGQYAAVTS